MGQSEIRVTREITENIESALLKVGIMFRLFSRAKSEDSIKRKLLEKKEIYIAQNRKMQDLIGLRIALYFADDQIICEKIVDNLFKRRGTEKDSFPINSFGPTRWNLVYDLPMNLAAQIPILQENCLIDSTFEIQFRTVLSEGWHEVEHDLRYKCKDSWAAHDDLSRSLNGIYASLEVSDWSMLKLFDEIAHRSYKNRDWNSLIRNKFRLRLTNDSLSEKIQNFLNQNASIAKKIYRSERSDFIQELLRLDHPIPITANNIVFLTNRLFIKNSEIISFEPRPINELFSRFETFDRA